MKLILDALSRPFTEDQCEQYNDGDKELGRVKPECLKERFLECGVIAILDVDGEYVAPDYIELKGEIEVMNGKDVIFASGIEYGGARIIKGEEHQARKSARTNLFARCCASFGMIVPTTFIEKHPIEKPIKVNKGGVVGDGAKGIEEMKDTARKAIENGNSLYQKDEAPQEKLEHKEEQKEAPKELEGVADTIEKLGGADVIHRAKIGFDAEFYNLMLEKKAGTPQIKELFEYMGFSPELWADAKRVTLPKLLTVYRELFDVSESQASMKVQSFLEGENMEGLPEPLEKEDEEESQEDEDTTDEESQDEETVFDSEDVYEIDDERFWDMNLENVFDFEWKFCDRTKAGEKVAVTPMERIDCLERLEERGVTKITYPEIAPQEILEKYPDFADLNDVIHPGYFKFLPE